MRKLDKGASYCASCFGQYMDREYVDLEAWYDGPVIETGPGVKMPIDDLILCETCLKEAARLIGLGYARDLRDENRELGHTIEEKDELIRKKDKMIGDLTHTMDDMIDNPPKRRQGRPKILVS